MPATTIRVDLATKRQLDRLQAELALRRGDRLSHSELLARLLEFVREREREFLGRAEWRPLTDAEWRALLRLVPRTGVRASARDIDRVLYGGERP